MGAGCRGGAPRRLAHAEGTGLCRSGIRWVHPAAAEIGHLCGRQPCSGKSMGIKTHAVRAEESQIPSIPSLLLINWKKKNPKEGASAPLPSFLTRTIAAIREQEGLSSAASPSCSLSHAEFVTGST